MSKQIIGLVLVLTICSVIVAFTQAVTGEKIAKNHLMQEQAQLRELLPDIALPDPLIWEHQQLNLCNPISVNRTITQGYGGEIQLLVAFENQTLTGVRVVRHSETPGLGDFIDTNKSSWISGFAGQPVATLDNTIDQVSGATITVTAMVRGVEQAANLQATPCS